MAIGKYTKFILTSAAILVVVVGCSVAVAKAISDKQEDNLNIEEPKTIGEIILEVRNLMRDELVVGVPIQAYIIPSVDAHQSEYISSRDQRMSYVSGFTGSAGIAIITEASAALWTDSRYHIQAEEQLDTEYWTLMKSGLPETPSYRDWLISTLPANSRVGIDPFLIEASEFESLFTTLKSSGHTLVAIHENLIDLIWTNKPALKLSDVEPLELRFSGKRASAKVIELRSQMKKLKSETFIVTALDEIAWLLNLRGLDIEYNPVFFSYVIVSDTQLYLFILDKSRITQAIRKHFDEEDIQVTVDEYNLIEKGIQNVLKATTGKIILSKPSQAIYSTVPADRRTIADSPISFMKVIKNAIEAEGMRNAHIRDGAALIKYLHWLEVNVDKEKITELSGAKKLKEFRSQQENFKGLSFTAISSVGAHAAMAHYSPTNDTDRQITRNEIYLIDSGGQYLDGTTDVTRTIHLGNPNDEEIDAFTRVLKGFISLNTAVFPTKAPLSFFDAMARRALWDVGLNYGHGTGHGVGAYLNVHEYPPLISSRNDATGMMENMFTSNEPGYYEEGQYGIRIEDVIQVVKATPNRGDFNGIGALKFYDITMAPIQTKLIKITLLTKDEVAWLNEYHSRVRSNVEPLLDTRDVYDWIVEQTKPISIEVC